MTKLDREMLPEECKPVADALFKNAEERCRDHNSQLTKFDEEEGCLLSAGDLAHIAYDKSDKVGWEEYRFGSNFEDGSGIVVYAGRTDKSIPHRWYYRPWMTELPDREISFEQAKANCKILFTG
jgi:hypothetical protein